MSRFTGILVIMSIIYTLVAAYSGNEWFLVSILFPFFGILADIANYLKDILERLDSMSKKP